MVKFPTALHIATVLRDEIIDRMLPAAHGFGRVPLDLVQTVRPLFRENNAPLEVRYFDMRLSDGRVYRVRVSDITPESGG